MTVDFWELIGAAPPGGLDTIINEESGWDILLDQGHATLRGKTKVYSMHQVLASYFVEFITFI
jgi:hypothetical protein